MPEGALRQEGLGGMPEHQEVGAGVIVRFAAGALDKQRQPTTKAAGKCGRKPETQMALLALPEGGPKPVATRKAPDFRPHTNGLG